MSEDLNENTAIFVGCIIGVMILTIFGLILCFCYQRNKYRAQIEKVNSRYEKINSMPNEHSLSEQATHTSHGQTETVTVTTNMLSSAAAPQSQRNIIADTSDSEQSHTQATDSRNVYHSNEEIRIPIHRDRFEIENDQNEQNRSKGTVTDSDSNESQLRSVTDSDGIDIDKAPMLPSLALCAESAIKGIEYDNTQLFTDKGYLEQNGMDLSRTHLCGVKYWKSNDFLLAIQCEWECFDNEGTVIRKVSSDIGYTQDIIQRYEPEECVLDFGSYLHRPITIQTGNYIHSISLMSEFEGTTNQIDFGGHGGTVENVSIPFDHIVIGFCGGYGGHNLHRLGVITVPYKESVGYDLVRVILSAYLEGHIWWQKYRITTGDKAVSDRAIECVLEYVFCLNAESDRFLLRDAFSDDEMDNGMEDIAWEQPRHDAKGTCVPVGDYNEKRAMEDAKIIRQALRGVDDHKLLEITGHRTNAQRCMIKTQYTRLYGEKESDLLADIERELNRGATAQLFIACYREIGEFDARLVFESICEQSKTDKYVLNELICTRTNRQMREMKNAWNKLETQSEKQWIDNRSMDECIGTALNDSDYLYKELILTVLKGQRFANKKINLSNVSEYTQLLFNDNRKRKRNQKQLCEILSKWSWSKIAVLSDEVFKKSNGSLRMTDIIKDMFADNTDVRDALCVIVGFCSNPYAFWSQKIKDSMSGIGTNNDMLIRCVVTRCEIDMFQTKAMFDQKCGDGASLKEWIETETAGFYQELLLLLSGYIETIDDMATDMINDEMAKEDNVGIMLDIFGDMGDIEEEEVNLETNEMYDHINENVEADTGMDVNDTKTEDKVEAVSEENKQDLVGIGIYNHEMNGIEEDDFEEDTEEESDVLSEISEEEDSEDKVDDIEQYKDVEAEHIESLLKMEIRKAFENPYSLGERARYNKLPKVGSDKYVRLERDLRRLTQGLHATESEDRKYCKIAILKHFEMLDLTFRRYCLIGGDRQWLTYKGWQHLYKDSCVVDRNSQFCNDEKCQNLYQIISEAHDHKKHIKNIESDWNGIWRMGNESKSENESVEIKLKQMSDSKLKGFMKSFEFCDINGVIKHDSNNQKTKKFIIFYHKEREQNKSMKCNAILMNEKQIKIEWEAIDELAQINTDNRDTENGTFVLNKIGELSENDNKYLKKVYGLLRYEFFDILLRLSQMKYFDDSDRTTHDYKFQSFLKLIQTFIIPFIWDDIHRASLEKDSFKWLFKKDSQSLKKVFAHYSRANQALLSEKEWKLFCKNLFNNSEIVDQAFKGKTKKGGKPNSSDIYESFQLAKTHLYHLNLTYFEFEKALQNLAHKIYKKKPKSKYDSNVDYQKKLKQLLQWCVKLQKQQL